MPSAIMKTSTPSPLVILGPTSLFSRRRRHTRCLSDWRSDVCSSDLVVLAQLACRLSGPRFRRSGRVPQKTLAARPVLPVSPVADRHPVEPRPEPRARPPSLHRALPRSGPRHRQLRLGPVGPSPLLRRRLPRRRAPRRLLAQGPGLGLSSARSEEYTSELQSL